ncbi:ankyrin, partial [Teratosphaeria nubilosa]
MVDDKCPLVITLARENRSSDLLEILKQGSNINEADPRNGKTAVMEAAQWGRVEPCRVLLKGGARLHPKDLNGETALHHAARNGDADICKMLLAAGALSEDCNKRGETPL